MPVTWLKAKYKMNKRTGPYKSRHNDGAKRRVKRPISEKERAQIRASQPLVTLHILPNGKRRFVKETRSEENANG